MNKIKNLGEIDLDQAKKIIDKFLEDKKDIKFIANFPVYKIIDYIGEVFSDFIDIDSNDSGSCHDLWFEYNDNMYVKMCTYHGDIYLYVKNKSEG
jgi:hypothetical protein